MVSTFDDLIADLAQARSNLIQATQKAETLQALHEGEGVDWNDMSVEPEDYGAYKVLARVRDETLVIYSVWTHYQWANCFPVQERLGWADPA